MDLVVGRREGLLTRRSHFSRVAMGAHGRGIHDIYFPGAHSLGIHEVLFS